MRRAAPSGKYLARKFPPDIPQRTVRSSDTRSIVKANSIKAIARHLCPPVVGKLCRERSSGARWKGDFQSWESATRESRGYEDGSILARVERASLAVKAGEAAFERDSALFSTPEYVWPLLAMLLRVASLNRGALRVLDFGGSLGSTYFQHKSWLDELPELTWCVVEQDHFVRSGRDHFEDDHLRFYSSIRECLGERLPDVVLFSSVLQYLPDPIRVLDEVVRAGIRHILIDRIGFTRNGRDRITVQNVEPELGGASYPCRFFGRDEFMARLSEDYELLASYPAIDASTPFADFFGMMFSRRNPKAGTGSL